MKKFVFGVLAFLLVLQAQAVFAAADYDTDFDKELAKNNLTRAENILRRRSAKMNLAGRLQRIILGNIRGFNSDNAITVAQMLIKYGVNVNAVRRVYDKDDYYYEAPLLYITVESTGLNKDQTVQMINLLCSSGANPDARNQIGTTNRTALMAASDYKPEWRIMYTKALVENGANVNLKDNNGNTALMYNINDNDTFKFLVENKADLDIRNNKGQTILILAAEAEKTGIIVFLVSRGANINLRDNNGMTAASICYDKGQVDLYDYLVANGAREFEPRQVTQQPTQPAAPARTTPAQTSAPAQSSSSSPSSSSSGWADLGKAIAESFKSPLQNGTYSKVGTRDTLKLTAIAKSGIFTYNVQGQTGTGSYSIDGNRMTIQLLGYTLLYTVNSETSFSGGGETWVRTGY